MTGVLCLRDQRGGPVVLHEHLVRAASQSDADAGGGNRAHQNRQTSGLEPVDVVAAAPGRGMTGHHTGHLAIQPGRSVGVGESTGEGARESIGDGVEHFVVVDPQQQRTIAGEGSVGVEAYVVGDPVGDHGHRDGHLGQSGGLAQRRDQADLLSGVRRDDVLGRVGVVEGGRRRRRRRASYRVLRRESSCRTQASC